METDREPARRSLAQSVEAGTRFRYGLLLGLIATSLAFQLAAPYADWSRLVTVLLQGATLLLALWTSRARPLLVRTAAIIIGLALVGSTLAIVSDSEAGKGATSIVNILLVGVAPVAVVAGVVRNLREEGGVTLTTMFGVLCVYLLAGMFFSFVYGTIDLLATHGVFAEGGDASQADFLYYSFTTLTTTGFGDLTVNDGLGRAVSITEALLGQIYLVTVVAAIVSNLTPRRP